MIRLPGAHRPVVRTLGDYRQTLVEQLFGNMLGLRMQELTQQPQPPFVGGGSGVSRLVPGYRSFNSSAVLGRQGMGPAVDALVQENARARQFGFSAAELERSKKTLLRSIEQSYAERDKTDSATYAAEYLRHFLEQETIPGIANERDYTRSMLPTITLDDVNRFARSVIPQQAARLVVYTGSDHADASTPTQAQLLDQVTQAEQRTVSAQTEKAVAQTLLAKPPVGGSIVGERHNAALGLTELDLSNGSGHTQADRFQERRDPAGGQPLWRAVPVRQTDSLDAAYAGMVSGLHGGGDFHPPICRRCWLARC
jgi:zinc protease